MIEKQGVTLRCSRTTRTAATAATSSREKEQETSEALGSLIQKFFHCLGRDSKSFVSFSAIDIPLWSARDDLTCGSTVSNLSDEVLYSILHETIPQDKCQTVSPLPSSARKGKTFSHSSLLMSDLGVRSERMGEKLQDAPRSAATC